MFGCYNRNILRLTFLSKSHAAPPNVYALSPVEIPQQPVTQTVQSQPAQSNDMHRLDALVAAATSDAGHR